MSISVTFTDRSIAGPSGPITAWDLDYGDGSSHGSGPGPWTHAYAAADTYTVSLRVTGTGIDGTATVTQSVPVVAAGGNSFVALTSWPRPTPTATRTVNFTNKAGLDAAIADMQAGDLIKYVGSGVLTLTSSSANGYTIQNKHMASPTVLDFGCSHNIWDAGKISSDYVAFRYTGSSNLHGLYLHDCSNLRIYGGDYSTNLTGGRGFWMTGGCSGIDFWDFYVHDCGGDATGVMPVNSGGGLNITNCTLRGEVTNWGHNLALDPHRADPGVGLHGCQFGDAATGSITNNTLALYAHDGPAGAGVQCGQPSNGGAITGNTFYVKAVNLTKVANTTTDSFAADALQFWGSRPLTGTRVGWVEGTNLQGTVVWASTTQAAPVVVDHGRHSNTNQNPHIGLFTSAPTNPYDPRRGITYTDCT